MFGGLWSCTGCGPYLNVIVVSSVDNGRGRGVKEETRMQSDGPLALGDAAQCCGDVWVYTVAQKPHPWCLQASCRDSITSPPSEQREVLWGAERG